MLSPAACGGFEGNAQTLRVLTRLEAKVLHPNGEPGGLNLTRATLDAACKYPWPRREGTRKFGYYAADADAFGWLRSAAPDGPPLPRGAGDGLGRRRGVLRPRCRRRRAQLDDQAGQCR